MIVAFGLGEGRLAIRLPDADLARAVEGLYPDYRLEAEAEGQDAPRVRLEARRTRDGFVLRGDPALLGGEDEVTVDTRVDLLTWTEEALARGLLALRSGLTHLHAAGASLPGGAVLALGPADAGKSSLALAWSVQGRALLGDDVVLLDPEGLALPFRRLLRVDPERLLEHDVDPRTTPHWSGAYARAWFDPRGAGGWCPGPARPSLVAFLDRRRDAPVRIEEVEPAEALALTLSGVLSTGAPPAASVDPIRMILGGARAVRLSYDASARAAGLLAELAADVGVPGGEPTGAGNRSSEPDPAGPARSAPGTGAGKEAR